MNSKKRILVAPLDWGLGHASRCIPIAKVLQKESFEVVFATSGRALELLIKEFPKNDFIKLEGYNISYPKNYPQVEPQRRCPDISKLIKEFNYKNKVSINDAIIRFHYWTSRYY